MLAVVAPLLQLYVNGDVPPVTLEVAVPFDAALHNASVEKVDTASVVGCDTVVVDVAEHPFASVTVTEYEPAASPDKFAVFAPLLQLYVNGDVPPVTLDVAVPFDAALQSTSVEEVVTARVVG